MRKKKLIRNLVLAFCVIIPAMLFMSACGKKDNKQEQAQEHSHTYNEEWAKNETHHWHSANCEHSDEKSEYAAHTYGEWTEKTPAALNQNRVEKRTCSVCDHEETREVANTALTQKNKHSDCKRN